MHMPLVASHVILPHENVCDMYASRTTRLSARVTLIFPLFNFPNRK
jgi:hypothetical protein